MRRRTLKTHNRAGQAFRSAAQAVSRTETAYGAFFRRMRAMHGPKKAIVVTAHKIARAVYRMLRDHKPFDVVQCERSHSVRHDITARKFLSSGATLALAFPPGHVEILLGKSRFLLAPLVEMTVLRKVSIA